MPVTPTTSADAKAREVNRLDILVDERHLMLAGRQRGQERQAGDWQVRSLAQQRQRVLEAPVGDFEARIDEDDSHGPTRKD